MIERSDHLELVTGRPPADTTDDRTQFDRLGDGLQRMFERLPLRGARRVIQHRFVDRQRRVGDGVHGCWPFLMQCSVQVVECRRAQLLLTIERRKNSRLAGRSANRRVK